jgi:hypothetical protein
MDMDTLKVSVKIVALQNAAGDSAAAEFQRRNQWLKASV